MLGWWRFATASAAVAAVVATEAAMEAAAATARRGSGPGVAESQRFAALAATWWAPGEMWRITATKSGVGSLRKLGEVHAASKFEMM